MLHCNKSHADGNHWQTVQAEIQNRTDWLATYKSAGLQIVNDTASSQGWITCRAIGRPDENPSAAIHSKSGCYIDHGSGEKLTPWEALSQLGYAGTKDWRDVRKQLADDAGVPMNGAIDQSAADKVSTVKLSYGTPLRFAKRKPGIKPEAIRQCGAMFGTHPADIHYQATPDKVNCLLVFNCHGADGSPNGSYHCCGDMGQDIVISDASDKVLSRTKTRQWGTSGWINDWGVEHLDKAQVVWIVEGLTDMLALQSQLGDRTDHVVLTLGGCSKRPTKEHAAMLKNKDVRILFDSEPSQAGYQGATGVALTLVDVATSVKIVQLDENPTKKIDARDFFAGGGTYQQLVEMAEDTTPCTRESLEAEATETKRQNAVIANATIVPLEGGGTRTEPIPLEEIIRNTKQITDGWPKKCAGELFVEIGGESYVLNNCYELFSYLHRVSKVDWKAGSGCLTKQEFFPALKHTKDDFKAMSDYPHFPDSLPGLFYTCQKPKPGDGTWLEKFLDFFPVSTDVDREILRALILTTFWSGPPGARPAFLITTTSEVGKGGTGSGKTTTAQRIGALTGGATLFTREKVENITTRILTGETCARLLMIDNIKSDRFSWADLEALITTGRISGKRLYRGNASVDNFFTWVFTANSAAFGHDIAMRTIKVELEKPKYNKDWMAKIDEFIAVHRDDVGGDVLSYFQRPPKDFDNSMRWGDWAGAILSLLDDPQAVHDAIVSRQAVLNTDRTEATDLVWAVVNGILDAGCNPARHPVFFSMKKLAFWLSEELNEKIGTIKAGKILRDQIAAGLAPNFVEHPLRDIRGFVLCLGEMKSRWDRKQLTEVDKKNFHNAITGQERDDVTELFEAVMIDALSKR